MLPAGPAEARRLREGGLEGMATGKNEGCVTDVADRVLLDTRPAQPAERRAPAPLSACGLAAFTT